MNPMDPAQFLATPTRRRTRAHTPESGHTTGEASSNNPIQAHHRMYLNFQARARHISILHESDEQAVYIIDGPMLSHNDRYEEFCANNGLNEYHYLNDPTGIEAPIFKAMRIRDSIIVQLATSSPVIQATINYVNNVVGAGNGVNPFPGHKYHAFIGEKVRNDSINCHVDVAIRSYLRLNLPNYVIESESSQNLLGVFGAHERMRTLFESPLILGGLIVVVSRPWNFVQHDDNEVLVIRYQRDLMGDAFRPHSVVNLGRQLTAMRVFQLETNLNLLDNTISGHGINGGWGRHGNNADDGIFSFNIPATLLMNVHPGNNLFNTPFGNMDIAHMVGVDVMFNCKDLMEHIALSVQLMELNVPDSVPINMALYQPAVW